MIKDLLQTEQRTAIERWCRDRARAVPMPDGKTLCRVLGEYPMVVDLNDTSVAPHLALDGFWELWLTMCLARRLGAGWNCIDVGANLGYFTVVMAMLTGGQVEAWEPMLDLQTMMKTTLGMNGLSSRVKQKCCAAGADESDSGELIRNDHDYGSASMRESSKHMSGQQRAHRVTVERIDRCTSLPTVDFVKIDAEGYEPQIWAGMSELFAEGRHPKAMLMEWSPKKYETPRGFLAAIERAGYTVHIVDGAGGLQKPVGDITEIDGHLDLWLSR